MFHIDPFYFVNIFEIKQIWHALLCISGIDEWNKVNPQSPAPGAAIWPPGHLGMARHRNLLLATAMGWRYSAAVVYFTLAIMAAYRHEACSGWFWGSMEKCATLFLWFKHWCVLINAVFLKSFNDCFCWFVDRHSPFRQHKTKDKHEIDRMTLTMVSSWIHLLSPLNAVCWFIVHLLHPGSKVLVKFSQSLCNYAYVE